jgi:predicted AAA+ superfamily ATPase
MNYKERMLSAKLKRLAEHFSVVVVCGARQVGKSTLISHIFPDWNSVTFDPVIDIGNARSDPELFLDNHPTPLILDEIQYSPEVVPCIKRRVDRNKQPGMYILTGSQQWSVIRSISESLAGRAVFLDLEGFMLAEINECIPSEPWIARYLDNPYAFVNEKHNTIPLERTLYEYLWRGWLPEMDPMPEDLADDYFSGYIRTYIERDVRQLLDVDDWQQFGRFVQLSAALSAQEINFSQLGRDIGITPQTAKRWLMVLKATFQWYEIPAYHTNSIKKISMKPKGYFADTGLTCHLNRISSPKALGGHPMTGSLFESAVAAEIRKMKAALLQKPEMYHWRLHSGSEVDIVLDRDGMLYPIEIKLTSRPTRKDARGIASLRKNYHGKKIAPGLIIAPTENFEQISESDYAVPWNLK